MVRKQYERNKGHRDERSKDATNGAPALTTRSKDVTRSSQRKVVSFCHVIGHQTRGQVSRGEQASLSKMSVTRHA